MAPTFRVNQRAVRERFKLLENTFKKKMDKEEKASSVNPSELRDTEIAVWALT